MNNVKYRWFQAYEKEKLEKLFGNQPTLEPIEQMTDRGWMIVGYKPLVDIKQIAHEFGRELKTIMNELIRGKYQEIPLCIAKQRKVYCYSKDASDGYHKKMIISKQRLSLKIYQHKDLLEFVLLYKHKQSLNSIAGRTKLETLSATISHQHFITMLIIHEWRKSIVVDCHELKNNIIDIIEGKRGTNEHLLTLTERKTRIGIAIKIHGKKAKTIVKVLRLLQEKYVLEFGHNILSITTDNGSEFWGWQEFQKSIYNACKSISVYFCHPYCSCEKGKRREL